MTAGCVSSGCAHTQKNEEKLIRTNNGTPRCGGFLVLVHQFPPTVQAHQMDWGPTGDLFWPVNEQLFHLKTLNSVQKVKQVYVLKDEL